jgi:MinD superfamily P-loop ATPase
MCPDGSKLGAGYETDFNAIGANGSECHDCGTSFIYCAVEGISAAREKLGFHYAGHNTWILVERKGVVLFDPFSGAGGIVDNV